jgi:transcriptional regulator EpsA
LKTTSLHAATSPAYSIPTDNAAYLEEYQRILTHSVKLRSHLEILVWLQGDMQRYLPHDIMIAAWGNFSTGNVRNDVISIVDGVRSLHSNSSILTPLLVQLFANWQARDKRAFVYSDVDLDPFLELDDNNLSISDALRGMRYALVHGIKDKRGSHDCLYLVLSSLDDFTLESCTTLTQVLPYIDHALRQVEHLPHQSGSSLLNVTSTAHEVNLRPREVEILQWIAMGKTNSEIGSILELSLFTVKNHVQRIFKKLNVSNRAQAVAVLTHSA